MKITVIILTLCTIVSCHGDHSKRREIERDIEENIRKTFQDPANFGHLAVGPGNGVLRVNQTLNNISITGLGKAKITKVTADLKEGSVFLSYEAKRITVHADYELDGYCLLMPIWGKGKGVVVMDDVKVTAKASVERVDNKIRIKCMKITFDISDGSFELSSLFGESQPGSLTPLYVKAFNANSRYIFNEILPPYIPKSEAGLSRVWGPILEQAQVVQ